MGIVIVGLTLVLCASSLLWVLWPLWKQGDAAPLEPEPEIDALALRQRETYTALRDLDFERELGNLTTDDYFVLRERYARRAIALLKTADERDREAASAVEEAVRTLRQARGRPANVQAPMCRRCGTNPADEGDLCGTCAHDASSPRQPTRKRLGGTRRWIVVTGGVMALFVTLTAVATTYLYRSATALQPIATLPTRQVVNIAFSPTVSGAVLLSTPNQLLRSNDGGKSWAPLGPNGTFGPMLTYGVPGSGDSRIWLAESDAIYESNGDDRAFTVTGRPRTGATITVLAVSPSDPRALYALVAGGALLHSDDGGVSWSPLNRPAQPGLPEDTNSLAILSGGSSVLFAASPTSGVFASSDGGRTWSASNGFVNGLLPTRVVYALLYDPGSGDRFTAPDGAVFHGALYAGTASGLFKSIDGGASWRLLSLHTPVTALALDPVHSATMLAVDDQGRLYESHDHAETWGH